MRNALCVFICSWELRLSLSSEFLQVKVMVRICPSQGAHETSESMSFLKVDPRKKQITFYDPAASGPSNAGHRRGVVAVPKMFAFDAVFPQDASQVLKSLA